MSVFRVEKTNDFTVMSNYHLRDRSISLKAKGLLSQMLSLPEDWDFTMAGLAHINKDGLASIKSTIDELVEAGYIIHSRVRNAKGQFKGAEYTIYEHPVGKNERMRSVTPIFKNELLVTDDIDQPFTFDGLPNPLCRLRSPHRLNRPGYRRADRVHPKTHGVGFLSDGC